MIILGSIIVQIERVTCGPVPILGGAFTRPHASVQRPAFSYMRNHETLQGTPYGKHPTVELFFLPKKRAFTLCLPQIARFRCSTNMYINIPRNPRGFAAELRTAHRSKDRGRVCQLIESIPPDRWIYLDGPEAVTSYDGARIAAHGGSVMDTYDRIYLSVLWPDQTMDLLGEYTAEELRLPTYIPPSHQSRRIAA